MGGTLSISPGPALLPPFHPSVHPAPRCFLLTRIKDDVKSAKARKELPDELKDRRTDDAAQGQ